MKYVNVFATENDYTAAKANLSQPQLVYVSGSNTIYCTSATQA